MFASKINKEVSWMLLAVGARVRSQLGRIRDGYLLQ